MAYFNRQHTFLSSASLSTYVKRFSFLGRVEPAVLPALPTRCIEGTYLNSEQLNLQSSDKYFIRALGSQLMHASMVHHSTRRNSFQQVPNRKNLCIDGEGTNNI